MCGKSVTILVYIIGFILIVGFICKLLWDIGILKVPVMILFTIIAGLLKMAQ